MTEVDFREPVSLFDYDQPEIVFAAAEPSSETVAQYQPPSVTEPDDTRDPITYDEKKGFWRRQFQAEATPSQRVFDWGFGVGFPIFCFLADPFVFKGGPHGGILSAYTPFAYSLAIASIALMALWLKWGNRMGFANALVGGLFAAGGLVSLSVGLAILPFSLLGLLVVIGILGFTPLVTAVIYLRNAYRAYLTAGGSASASVVYHTFFLVGLLSVVIPYLINVNAGSWIGPINYALRSYYGPMY